MMKVVDELMTPGCPQCAVKHLSAALFHRARGRLFPWEPRRGMEYVAIACINLYEVFVGYRSHLWYAVGALVTAEEQVERGRAPDATIREVRLMLEEKGLGAVPDALERLVCSLAPSEWELAHFYEARRELPASADEMRLDDLAGSIERIRREYFITDQEVAVDTSEEVAGEGGEEAMATKAKKPAFLQKGAGKKADPKAAKAACKGGKCKGGKCKK